MSSLPEITQDIRNDGITFQRCLSMEQPTQDQQLDSVHIRVERRALLVVAGLPGAGKSTLLRDTRADGPITVLDTDHIRRRLAAVLPSGTPYVLYRPLAPILQRLRILLTAVVASGPVVVHNTATAVGTRVMLVVLGALTGRPCHLLWIDCSPAEALIGQYTRGRLRLKGSFARQVRRTPRLRVRLRSGRPPRGWRTATVLDRPTARRGLHLLVG